MAFNFLQGRMNKAIKNVQKRAILSEDNINDILNEIRIVLLEADVNLKVVDEFIHDLKQQAIGQTVGEMNTSSQKVLALINNELIKLFGTKPYEWQVAKPDTIMMVGLQGSGKTTTVGKLANALTKDKKYNRPILIGLDIYRPAAIDQLETLANKLNVDFYSNKNTKDVYQILNEGLAKAKENDNDLIILDTAGRLQTNIELMTELEKIKSIAKPSEIIFVADAMSGQEIVNVASEFNNHLKLSGTIITKLDSDAKGGAALSIRSILNIPIMFVGVGEKLDNLEKFYPDRMVSRILGLGDIQTLTEKAQDVSDESKNERMFRKILAGNFDLEDLIESMKQMKKMGNIGEVMKLIPGAAMSEDKVEFMEKKLVAYQALIDSMTRKERKNVKLLNFPKRKDRIIKGSGRTVQEYNELLRQFERSIKQMNELVKQIKSGRVPDFKKMMNGGK